MSSAGDSIRLRAASPSFAVAGVRPSSNLLESLSPLQFSELKEVFSLIDRDSDGLILEKDLRDALNSLGMPCSDAVVSGMLAEASGNINLTMFITLFARRISTIENEDALLSAFKRLSESGPVSVEQLRGITTTLGSGRVSVAEFDEFATPFSAGKHFDYKKFVNEIK